MDNIITNQREWIKKFNNEHREDFNDELFERDNYDLINSLKDAILSCQRDKYFTIRVDKFTVIESYEEIYNILYNYEQQKIDKNKNRKTKIDNPMKYINIKDSDIMLLIVDYYISVNNPEKFEEDTLQVIIAVPRIVNKYYFRIGGGLYSAIYQIVDGSTYNNTSSSSKKQSVTFKTAFMPIRIYRNVFEDTDDNGEVIKFTVYVSRIFNKNIPVIEYIFAKFGLYGGLEFLGISGSIFITEYEDEYLANCNTYFFERMGIFIYVPKELFDQNTVVQCAVMTIVKNLSYYVINKQIKDICYSSIKKPEYWLKGLALRFNSKPLAEKGLSILDSLESIYDIETRNTIRLDPSDKENVYTILRWLIREFQTLRLKDNADISTKKVRLTYISSYYTFKVSKGIYRACDNKGSITVDQIKRYIRVEPDFLLNAITKDKLVPYRTTVNDNDALTALKFSFKGKSGLGEQANSTIPDSYRQLHPSSLTRIDPDTSSASDPGLTGILCPMTKLYNTSFAPEDYTESTNWQEQFDELMQIYYSLRAKKQVITFKEQIGGNIFEDKINELQKDVLDFAIEQNLNAINSMREVDDTSEYHECTVIEDTDDGTKSFIIWEN